MLIVTQTHISIHNNICNVAPVLQKVVICATMLDYPFWFGLMKISWLFGVAINLYLLWIHF